VKRGVSIFFLMIMMANAAGFYVYYAVRLNQLRHEQVEALKTTPGEKLHILRMSTTGFALSRVDEHEVRVNNKMYDIAWTRISGDSIFVYCLHDEKEDTLFAFLEEIVASPLNNADDLPHVINDFLTLTFIVTDCSIPVIARTSVRAEPTKYSFSTITFRTENDSPPPWKTRS
jgi:hypothetical protein